MSALLNRKQVLSLAIAVVVAAFVSAPAIADAAEVSTTTVTVGEMCGGCVKRITARFEEEKDVAKLTCDIESKTIALVPVEGVRLSPKGIWEVFESINKNPEKLVGPDGTFTSKPE